MALTDRPRVLLLGLDSADLDYIERRLGDLPALRRVFAEGIVRRLDSPATVMSASVWPTFFTGTLPGEHGRYFPIQWDPAGMRLRLAASDWIDCEPFWRPLARAGSPVTTLDVPMTFPSNERAGVEIVNWGARYFGDFHCTRPDLAREIARRFGTDVLGPDVPVPMGPRRLASLRTTLLAGARRRGELSRWLAKNTEWSLFVTVFAECHRAGHYFWRDSNASRASDDGLLEVYRAVDREVGALIEAVDLRNTTVIVFSLHGMEANHSQMHLVPPVIAHINEMFLAPDVPPPVDRRPPKRSLMGRLRERVPAPLQEAVALRVPGRVRDWVVGRAFTGGLDWRRTPGFALPTGGEGYVRFNVAGREAEGWLARDSAPYRRYVESVREGFLSLRNGSTGDPLVDSVTVPGEVFPGPRSDYLPDVAIGWRHGEPATAAVSERLGTFTARLKTGRGGNHRSLAFAAIAGPARDSPRVSSLTTIVDLAGLVRDLAVGAR